MTQDWKYFLWLKVPLAIIVIVIFGQAASHLLERVPMRRFETDGFPGAIANDSGRYKVVLFGDSVTRNATRNFNVGDQATVLNLASHLHIGLAGDILLIKRYLETHAPPAVVEIVSTPSMFTEAPDLEKIYYYTWRIFSRPDEHDFLRKLFPGVDKREDYLAIMDIQQKILEPLLSLVQGGAPRFYTHGRDPSSTPELEPASTDLSDESAISERIRAPMNLLPPYAMALKELCHLSLKYDFKIDIVWAPAPAKVYAAWKSSGKMEDLQTQIGQVTGSDCNFIKFTDFNEEADYLSFDHAARHLRGEGWEQLFASQMRDHIATTVRSVSPSATR